MGSAKSSKGARSKSSTRTSPSTTNGISPGKPPSDQPDLTMSVTAEEVLNVLAEDPIGKVYAEKALATAAARQEQQKRIQAEQALEELRKLLPSADN